MFSLQQALALPDPAFAFAWACTDMSVPQSVRQIDYRNYVHSVSLTHPYFQANAAFRAAKNFYYPGQYDVNSISVNMYEDSNYSTHKFLQSWRTAICDPRTRAYTTPFFNKGSITIALLSGLASPSDKAWTALDVDDDSLNSDPMDSTVMTVELRGVFPTTQSPTDLDFSNGGRIIVPIEFSVDECIYRDEFGNQI